MTGAATSAFVWGLNSTGELGLGHAARTFDPAPAALPPNLVDVQGGADFTVALSSTGQVWTWGANQFGQLGDGSTAPRRTPRVVRLPRGVPAAAIAAGTDHVIVLTTRGGVATWGRNHRGQLGLGDRVDRSSPLSVSIGPVKTVAAGDGISAAISVAGRLVTWGRNGFDQLALEGVAKANQDVLKPLQSRLFHQVTAVDAGLRHLVVLTWTRQVYAFGLDAAGKPLGRQVRISPRLGQVRAISAGEDHTLALTDRGDVLSWGANDLGQLGVGDHDRRLRPTMVALPAGAGRATHVRAGHRHSLVLTNHDQIFAWGDAHFGAVGLGRPKLDEPTAPAPRRVPLPPSTGLRLAGGGYSSAVLVRRSAPVRLRLEPQTATGTKGTPR